MISSAEIAIPNRGSQDLPRRPNISAMAITAKIPAPGIIDSTRHIDMGLSDLLDRFGLSVAHIVAARQFLSTPIPLSLMTSRWPAPNAMRIPSSLRRLLIRGSADDPRDGDNCPYQVAEPIGPGHRL
jgi:hypothetical protein